MRILVVISGMLLAIAGAFTFAFYTNAFTGLAFVLGLVMLISGMCILGAYIISGKVGRLPDTVLVEGMVTTLFGFAVLNNEVMEAMVTLFFGTWMTLSGVTRISQSFAVSRYRPKDWAKVMPLALAGTIIGVLMLMPSLTTYINPLFLVGAAFIVNGLSQLIYSMYMRKHELTEREIEAQERAEARKAAKEAERKQRNANRTTSWHEREEQREEQRRQEKRRLAEQRAAKLQELQERRAARRPATVTTMEFTAEEVEEINLLAEEPPVPEEKEPEEKEDESITPTMQAGLSADPDELPVTQVLRSRNKAAADPVEYLKGEIVRQAEEEERKAEALAEIDQSDEALSVLDELQAYEPEEEEPEETEEEKLQREALEKAKAPVWNRPENIPSLRARKLEEEAAAAAAAAEEETVPEIEDPLAKRAAINIEKIEEGLETVEFEPVELPEPELEATGGEAEERVDIIRDLEKEIERDDPFKPFEALKLEDLFGDDYVPLREKDPKEATRFTQSLNLDWTKR
ncbi:MAG: DUF308 domain-containing protein [Firmicutes bacterium]|nr:DUF308 domain-containing protein [Bacillota bacterium]